jgi:hypothetical protein
VLDYHTPHEFGGLGDCIKPQYNSVNLFQDNRDIPMIFPKTATNNKNEFNVGLEQVVGSFEDPE